jgi:hypothetical protein
MRRLAARIAPGTVRADCRLRIMDKSTRKLRMFKLPQSIVFAILAFNLTLFTIMLQMDLLIFNSPIAKVIAWLATIALWSLTYIRRKKYFKLF